jgi:hypothetical protein
VIGWKLSKAELEIERLGERESGFWRRDLVTQRVDHKRTYHHRAAYHKMIPYLISIMN